MGDYTYGPERPESGNDIATLPTRDYLRKYPKKIRRDLERLFRLYTGKQVRLFKLDKQAGRCPECTNEWTGSITHSNCPSCGGTGYLNSYVSSGDFWVQFDLSSKVKTPTELGNMERITAGKDIAIFLGEPLLKDTDLVIIKENKQAYKVVDAEPQIVAVGGEIITQMVGLDFLPEGSKEYKYQVDW